MADSTITMGNDEFILYIRKKNKKCSLSNDQLGKKFGNGYWNIRLE